MLLWLLLELLLVWHLWQAARQQLQQLLRHLPAEDCLFPSPSLPSFF
jgi:hypothetical protein